MLKKFGYSLLVVGALVVGVGAVSAFTIPGVDNWGHLGGFSGGLIVAFLVGYEDKSRQSQSAHSSRFFLAVIRPGVLRVNGNSNLHLDTIDDLI